MHAFLGTFTYPSDERQNISSVAAPSSTVTIVKGKRERLVKTATIKRRAIPEDDDDDDKKDRILVRDITKVPQIPKVSKAARSTEALLAALECVFPKNVYPRHPKEDAFSNSECLFKSARIPEGFFLHLFNYKNNYFINVVLQCILLTKPFIYEIHYCKHFKPCESHTIGFCIICTLDSLFMSMVNYTSRALFAYKFVRHITLFSSSFTPFRQEDAHEFLLGVLNLLEIKFNDTVIISTCKPDQIVNPAKAFFQCFVTHTLSCPVCQHTSIQSKPYYGLSLGITKEKSLIDALSFHT
ncbi:UCH domain-containing protein [Cephalotus follicularis]|uniref:UCH domain-containing protein n=1 Tax=Cephalotus follicularis TaxID=3775 RepID=A0A1Q3CAB2_CEPFO|nr:UCH domain-containing protein [Cephalotus follicularis]